MPEDQGERSLGLKASELPPRTSGSAYPKPFDALVVGRTKTILGDRFGLSNFGVNLTRLAPGAQSSVMHRHSRQDEFVYILEGTATLLTDRGNMELSAGMCAGFKAGEAELAHCLINNSSGDVVYLEIGDRADGDEAHYPYDDLVAKMNDEKKWDFFRKNGSRY